MKITLWYVKETEKAYLYSKTPKGREQVNVWIPKSQVEGRTKMGDEHIVTVADWFAEKEGL